MNVVIPFVVDPSWCDFTSSNPASNPSYSYDPATHTVTFYEDSDLTLSGPLFSPYEQTFPVTFNYESGATTGDVTINLTVKNPCVDIVCNDLNIPVVDAVDYMIN